MLQIQLEGCRISFIAWDIFKNKLQMKVYKIKIKLKNLQKKEAGGVMKHVFPFTRLNIVLLCVKFRL